MRIAPFVMLCAAALILVVARGCYAPDQPNCTYRCDPSADNNGHCPWDYECRADGYCHLKGSTGMCSYPPPPDLQPGPDLATPADMAMSMMPQDAANAPDASDPMPDLAHNDF